MEECIKSGKPALISPLEVLTHLPTIKLSKEEESSWCKGQPLTIDESRFKFKLIGNKQDTEEQYILVLDCECELIGMGKWKSQLLILQPKIVLNAEG